MKTQKQNSMDASGKNIKGGLVSREEGFAGPGADHESGAAALKHSELPDLKWQRSFTNLIPQDDYFGD